MYHGRETWRLALEMSVESTDMKDLTEESQRQNGPTVHGIYILDLPNTVVVCTNVSRGHDSKELTHHVPVTKHIVTHGNIHHSNSTRHSYTQRDITLPGRAICHDNSGKVQRSRIETDSGSAIAVA
jgi:hypothetical protein